jgi:hypothetical protein
MGIASIFASVGEKEKKREREKEKRREGEKEKKREGEKERMFFVTPGSKTPCTLCLKRRVRKRYPE